jgi:hypothetical protein
MSRHMPMIEAGRALRTPTTTTTTTITVLDDMLTSTIIAGLTHEGLTSDLLIQ